MEMFQTVPLIKHSISQERNKVLLFSNHNLFYSQNWRIPFSFSKDSYISPYFSHPSFKIIFKIVFDDNKDAKLYVKLADIYLFQSIKLYFFIGDPEGPNTSLTMSKTFKPENRCEVCNIPKLTKGIISEDQDWLDDSCNLNIYFELCYYIRSLLKERQQIQENALFRSTLGNPGLKPANNFCYMNSSLQILYHIPRIRTIIYSIDNRQKSAVLFNTQSLFYSMERSHTQCSAEALHNSIPFCRTDAGRHKDACEFIMNLNSSLDKEIMGTNQQEQLSELFKISFKSNFEGKNFRKTEIEVLNSLAVSFKFAPNKDKEKLHNLSSCIHEFEEKEEIDYDTGIDGIQKVYKWCEFEHIPPILQIDLKRFENDAKTKQLKKIETPIEFPEELTFCDEKYDIYAILSHKGSLDGGHYFSFIRNFPTENWYKYNDSLVTKIDLQSAIKSDEINKAAYVLFYVRKKDESRLFEKSEISPSLRNSIEEYETNKLKEIKAKDIMNLHFILEEELNDRKSIEEKVKISSKILKIKESKSMLDLYNEVADLFSKKVDQIRLWTVDFNSFHTKLLDKSPHNKINSIRNNGVIFVQNKKEDEFVVPDVEGDEFNDINYLVIFVKYFDKRLELPIRYIGPIIVDGNCKLETPKISQILGFPSWTKYHFFREMNHLSVKLINNNNTFNTVRLLNGYTLVVQVDFEATKEASKLSNEELRETALFDLSKSPAFKDVKLVSSELESPTVEPILERSVQLPNYKALDFLPNFDANRLDNYLSIKYNMKHITFYDYQRQKTPVFSLDIPTSVGLNDLVQIVKTITKPEENESILLFDKKKDLDSASFDPIKEFRYETTINGNSFVDDTLYFLKWPNLGSFENKQIYLLQISVDGYNPFYKRAVFAKKQITAGELLFAAALSLKDLPKDILSFCKSDRIGSGHKIQRSFSNRNQLPDRSLCRNRYTIERTNSSSFTKDPPRCYEVNNSNICQTFLMKDKINFLCSRTIRFATFIPPGKDEVAVQVYQVKVKCDKMFEFINEPFFMNVKQRSTVGEFKEKVLKNIDVNEEEFLSCKLEVVENGKKNNGQSSGDYLTKEDDEIPFLKENSYIYIVYE